VGLPSSILVGGWTGDDEFVILARIGIITGSDVETLAGRANGSYTGLYKLDFHRKWKSAIVTNIILLCR
jgi:hypothetical protein